MEDSKKIIHIDMDAFYASVEQRDHTELRGKPIAVGGAPGGRGVLTTASYEARVFGVRSAMPSSTAARLCPDLIFVKPRMAAYKEVSVIVRKIFHRYTDLVEPLSIDEAFLDVTVNKLKIDSALKIAAKIKQDIFTETQLTSTAGVSYNKFLAKLASGANKPDGLNFISKEKAEEILLHLPIGEFYGIGKKTAEKMQALGIQSGKELKSWSREYLQKHFGKMGSWYFDIVRGTDSRKVNPNRETKSVSSETTFSEDSLDPKVIKPQLENVIQSLLRRIAKGNYWGRTITLKVKFHDFKSITRSKSFGEPVKDEAVIREAAIELLSKSGAYEKPIRLIGLGVSNFGQRERRSSNGQLSLDLE